MLILFVKEQLERKTYCVTRIPKGMNKLFMDKVVYNDGM